MKIVFTGGGTGGHFYPIIAIKEAMDSIAGEQKIKKPETFYFSTDPYNEALLAQNNIIFKKVISGKMRKYKSAKNITDVFLILIGIVDAFFKLLVIYPDIVLGKGGYASTPTLIAARMLKIPVMIHESDTVPGRVNKWAGMFAKRVAISYEEASEHFQPRKTALTGQPIRKKLLDKAPAGAFERLKTKKEVPIITVVGGSQGAKRINDIILDALPKLIEKYQILHQTGLKNYEETIGRTKIIFESLPDNQDRYRVFPYVDSKTMLDIASVSSLVISRSGSMIFEIAHWGVPSILIPIPETISRDQRTNAFAYARSGGAIVMEEENLTVNLLLSEIEKLFSNPDRMKKMSNSAKNFSSTDAAYKIADELLNIAISHG